MAHDPETVRQVAQHAHEAGPWYMAWASQMLAGSGVVTLWLLKFIGNKELQRRASYATQESVNETMVSCKTEIVGAIDSLKKENKESIKALNARMDDHLENQANGKK